MSTRPTCEVCGKTLTPNRRRYRLYGINPKAGDDGKAPRSGATMYRKAIELALELSLPDDDPGGFLVWSVGEGELVLPDGWELARVRIDREHDWETDAPKEGGYSSEEWMLRGPIRDFGYGSAFCNKDHAVHFAKAAHRAGYRMVRS